MKFVILKRGTKAAQMVLMFMISTQGEPNQSTVCSPNKPHGVVMTLRLFAKMRAYEQVGRQTYLACLICRAGSTYIIKVNPCCVNILIGVFRPCKLSKLMLQSHMCLTE